LHPTRLTSLNHGHPTSQIASHIHKILNDGNNAYVNSASTVNNATTLCTEKDRAEKKC